jgi:hypothetical protein
MTAVPASDEGAANQALFVGQRSDPQCLFKAMLAIPVDTPEPKLQTAPGQVPWPLDAQSPCEDP